MDCCENTQQNENRKESVKGVKSMVKVKKNMLMWIVIGVLFLSVLFLTYKTSTIGKASATGNVVDITDWTANEKMNYEMHGIIPARLQGKVSSASSGTGMVGGC